MEYVFPSSHNDPLLRIFSPNKGSEIFVTSRQEELPFFKHFPSPFLDDISTTQLAQPKHNHLMFPNPNKRLNIDSTEPSSSSTTPEISPKKKKRSGKKDRHSKIRTVHGLRDRRMRLSLEISRKFFDLQDMLGFDKASKTIDWLFSKSKKAIKEVTLTLPLQMKNNQGTCIEKRGESPLSKREAGVEITEESKARVGLGRKLPRKSRDLPTLNCNAPVARESREKARARARERTREKMLNKCLERRLGQCEWFEANPNSNLGQLGLGFSKNTNMVKLKSSSDPFKPSWSSHSHSSQDRNFSLEDQFANVEIIEKLLGTSCSAFGYLKSSATIGSLDPGSKFLEFLENRDAKDLKINPNTNVDPFTVTVQGQNPSYNPMTSFNMNFHSQHPGGRSVQFP